MEEQEVTLPQTKEQLEQLIQEVATEYNFPVCDETVYSITRLILQLPSDQATIKKSALGHGTLRGITQTLTYPIHEEVRKRLAAAEEEAKNKTEETKLSLVTEDTQTVGPEPLQGA